MKTNIGENWCSIEIYNEYLKKITNLLTQINTVEKMQYKAEMELQMLEDKKEDSSRGKYEKRLISTKAQCEERLRDMLEELSLVQNLKEDLENKLPILRGKDCN